MPTTTISINTQDRRDVRALRLLQDARTWAKTTREIPGVGTRKFYGIPSESEGGVYRLTNRRQCSCPDFQNRQDGGTFACAHIRAVRFYVQIVLQERRKAAAVQAEFERQQGIARDPAKAPASQGRPRPNTSVNSEQQIAREEAEARAKSEHSWRMAQKHGLVDAF